jgi:hypothetical protein
MNVKLNFKESILAGSKAAGVSVIINVILFYVFHVTGVIKDSFFIKPNEALTVVPVIISSIIPSLIGALVFFLFEKFTENGFKLFSIVAIILMLLSLASPFLAVQGMPIGYGIVLDMMHLVVAFSLLYFIKIAK